MENKMRYTWIFITVATLGVSLFAESGRYTWKENGVTREVFLVENSVADFSVPGVQVRKVSKTAFRKSMQAGLPAYQSPVFSDSPNGGSLRALPGGLVVTFPKTVSQTEAQAWARRHGVEIDKRIGTSGPMWLMKSEPGLPGLELANRISESTPGVSVTPNWWLQLVSKSAPSVSNAPTLQPIPRHQLLK